MYELARSYGKMSDDLYSPTRAALSGTDPIDGERYRLVAKAFRRLGSGEELETVLTETKAEWDGFARSRQAAVDAAPKLKRGPRAGHSCIAHKWAGEGEIEGNLMFVRRMYNQFK